MNEEDLFDQNPWWRGRENIFHDPKVKKFDGASIKWEPRMKRCFHLEEGLVYTLRGPRQVGKTTLLKNLIRYELIKKRADPYSIFYFSSDLIDKKEELLELIALYEKIADRFGVKGRRKILIDEITNVRDWEKAIKYLRDTGKGKDHTFILTGSHSIDIKKSVERLPGRRGEGSGHILNKILVPMKFSEYIGTVDKELAKDLSEILSLHSEDRIRMIKDLSNGKMDGSIERLNSVYSRELDKWLDSYLLSGGIPVPIEHLVSGGSIPNDVYGIYVRSLMGDLARWGMKERIAKQIIRSVIEKMTTKVSLNAIAKENEIGSHNTVMKYLDNMESSFVLNTFYQLDRKKSISRSRSDKKYYLSDPFIFHALRGWTHGKVDLFRSSVDHLMDSSEKGKMVEMVISDHLIRFAYEVGPSDIFSHHDKVLFWKKKGSGTEVDLILNMRDELVPVEVKYRNSIRSSDLKGIHNFGSGIIVTKGEIKVDRRYSFIPSRMFLLLI